MMNVKDKYTYMVEDTTRKTKENNPNQRIVSYFLNHIYNKYKGNNSK